MLVGPSGSEADQQLTEDVDNEDEGGVGARPDDVEPAERKSGQHPRVVR